MIHPSAGIIANANKAVIDVGRNKYWYFGFIHLEYVYWHTKSKLNFIVVYKSYCQLIWLTDVESVKYNEFQQTRFVIAMM